MFVHKRSIRIELRRFRIKYGVRALIVTVDEPSIGDVRLIECSFLSPTYDQIYSMEK